MLLSGVDFELITNRIGTKLAEDREIALSPWGFLRYKLETWKSNVEQQDLIAQAFVEFAKAARGCSALTWNDLVPGLRKIFTQSQFQKFLEALGRISKARSGKRMRRAVNETEDSDTVERGDSILMPVTES